MSACTPCWRSATASCSSTAPSDAQALPTIEDRHFQNLLLRLQVDYLCGAWTSGRSLFATGFCGFRVLQLSTQLRENARRHCGSCSWLWGSRRCRSCAGRWWETCRFAPSSSRTSRNEGLPATFREFGAMGGAHDRCDNSSSKGLCRTSRRDMTKYAWSLPHLVKRSRLETSPRLGASSNVPTRHRHALVAARPVDHTANWTGVCHKRNK